jgi:hypothetical protein
MAISKTIKDFMEQASWIRRIFEEEVMFKAPYSEGNL